MNERLILLFTLGTLVLMMITGSIAFITLQLTVPEWWSNVLSAVIGGLLSAIVTGQTTKGEGSG